jgi:tetratricopeptide (TPR) repeat protein
VLHDQFGLPVATHERAVVDAIDRFTTEVLSHGQQAAAVLDAVVFDPDAALAHACCAALFLFLQTADGTARATPWLERARRAAAAPHTTERERLFVAALEAWWRGAPEQALRVHRQIAGQWPRDLLNAKLAQVHQLNAGERADMHALASTTVQHAPEVGYAWGLHAFALEQVGELEAAQAAGERAVALNADDPWAQHAVAHVHEARGATQAGIVWLQRHADRWERCSSFMQTHNWWHLALFYLAAGDAAAALALHDRRVWGVRKGYVQDQVNAVSLLARLELAGVDVGARWLDVAAHVRERIFDRQNPFLDLHFAYALARAGDEVAVAKLLGGIADHARRDTAPVWCEVALPAIRGAVAFARSEWSDAAERLAPLAPRMHRLGGSTAQHGWFAQMRQAALARSRTPARRPVRLAA